MFSKSRINESGNKSATDANVSAQADSTPSFLRQNTHEAPSAAHASKSKPAASVLASDLTVTGNLRTTGDIVVEGNVDGDIQAHLLTVGETATIRGEVLADDIVINGRVIGRVRGLKVRLTSSAQVEGDIIHKTIAIESGAHFEGSVQRQENPLQSGRPATQSGNSSAQPQSNSQASQPAPAPQQSSPAVSEAVKKAADSKKSAQS